MPAGAVATALDLAPNTLTFHFDRLRTAGLVTVRRDGRSMIYAAQFETMNSLLGYLTDNCSAVLRVRLPSNANPYASAPKFQPERKEHKASACSRRRQ
jgi:DNA-binding transcriptional ArsR family regulator